MCRLGIGGEPFTHLTKEDAASAKVWGLDLRQVTVQTSSTQNQAPDLKATVPQTWNNKMMPVIVTEITGIVRKLAVMCVELNLINVYI